LVQEFRFLVESETLDNPVHLARIRQLPAANGRPVPVCKACQTLVESAPIAPIVRSNTRPHSLRVGVLATIGLLSVGWLVQNMIFGPVEY
jgi:hypothetical protein